MENKKILDKREREIRDRRGWVNVTYENKKLLNKRERLKSDVFMWLLRIKNILDKREILKM